MSKQINLGKLSFYWRMTDQPDLPKNPVPDFVDFSFEFDEAHQLIIQTRNQKTWEYLETIYKENYNVGYLQEGHDLAEGYGNDFIEFISNSVNSFNPKAKRISEIGAGGCYVLNRLKKLGYEVAAIDPSPIAIEKGKELGIEVVPAFYPAENGVPKSDVLIHYDVLEHVTDPVAFLKHHQADLNNNGLILFAVPDCTAYIASGDVSMILHEHLNYYDQESLKNIVEAAGFAPLVIRKANYGGVLYCAAKVDTSIKYEAKTGVQKFDTFEKRLKTLSQSIENFIREGTSPGNTLGCYIPLRALPYLSMLNVKDRVRFFDDNKGIYKQYFDGFNVPVENRSDLVKQPVSHLLILSAAFGDKIKNMVTDSLPGNTIKIMTLGDFIKD